MRIVFFPQSCAPVHASILNERPLGGIETAIVRLAEILHSRGHSVTVYTSDPNPPASEPLYAPLAEARNMQEVDVFVCIREWIPLLSQIPAKAKLFWTGDAADQIQNFGIGDKRIASLVDGFLAVSDWQASTLSTSSGFPFEKMHVIRNGIHLPYFEKHSERVKKRLIYTSTPFRGLEFLPAIFRGVQAEHPDATLEVYSGFEVYQSEQTKDYLAQLEARYQPVFDELATIPGVTLHGNVLQAALAEAMLSSEILCYPNSFPETSCISVMEAQAAGAVPITSNLAALPETVGDAGILIPGAPGSPDYLHAFTTAINELLNNSERLKELSGKGQQRALHEHSWQQVAIRLERILATSFKLV